MKKKAVNFDSLFYLVLIINILHLTQKLFA